MIQPPKPVPVYDMEKLPKASVYIQAEEKIMNLSPQQKQQLASYIIHSANWEKMLKKELFSCAIDVRNMDQRMLDLRQSIENV